MSNTRVEEKVREKVVINEGIDVKITPPENYDVMLYNSNTVHFFAVRDVLAAVLQINAMRAMAIVMRAHMYGKASVYTGPRDVAEQYKEALLAEAAVRAGDPDGEFKGYARMQFEVEKSPHN